MFSDIEKIMEESIKEKRGENMYILDFSSPKREKAQYVRY